MKGGIAEAMKGADVFIGVSGPNVITTDDVRRMAKDRVVFALANPNSEIAPEEALPLVRIMATGRSDYPNQINNMLCFPGLFRGLLDVRATGVNEEVKLAAARAIADSRRRRGTARGLHHPEHLRPEGGGGRCRCGIRGGEEDGAGEEMIG